MEYDLWFQRTKLTNYIKFKLINEYKTTKNLWEQIFKYKKINGTYRSNVIDALKSSWDIKIIDKIKQSIYISKIGSINIWDENYPKMLKNIDDPPYMLFYYGDITKINASRNISIIGSREISPYGQDICGLISGELSKLGLNVISGMAKGVDGFVHNSVICNNGFTVCVLGSGVDVIYPMENEELYFKTKKQGLILSEFLPGTPAFRYNFPIRNRIISGLSELVVIVEAAKKSGTLITAKLALEQGRNVMAVPGSIFSKNSEGTNNLIKDGAYVFTSMEDIFEVLNINYNNKITNESTFKNSHLKNLYDVIKTEPIHIDDIVRIVKCDMTSLYEMLFELQLDEKIIPLQGNFYKRNVL